MHAVGLVVTAFMRCEFVVDDVAGTGSDEPGHYQHSFNRLAGKGQTLPGVACS